MRSFEETVKMEKMTAALRKAKAMEGLIVDIENSICVRSIHHRDIAWIWPPNAGVWRVHLRCSVGRFGESPVRQVKEDDIASTRIARLIRDAWDDVLKTEEHEQAREKEKQAKGVAIRDAFFGLVPNIDRALMRVDYQGWGLTGGGRDVSVTLLGRTKIRVARDGEQWSIAPHERENILVTPGKLAKIIEILVAPEEGPSGPSA